MRRKTYKIFIGLVLLTIVFCSILFADNSDIYQIREINRTEFDTRQEAEISHGGFKSAVSQQNLLGLERNGKSLLPTSALDITETRTIKACAIRVQFQYEDEDDDSTTGRGHFDFRDYDTFVEEERHAIDPAPHNRQFFEKHMEALNNYWSVVSDGRVEIVSDVFPVDPDSVYTLPHTMGHYGSQAPELGLGEFFADALAAADLDDDVVWIDYDVFFVFHAGSDRQSDLGFPPTPHDLFTGFIKMGSPIWVEDNTIGIVEGVLMPETVSQDNRASALNAVMAHEFGHQLGLVDLYDTRTFTTIIGDFSLMDNNGFGTGVDLGFERTRTILGTLPLYPDAWSRAYLGFVEVVEIQEGINFEIFAGELESAENKVYKIPISENEYYLIENRQVDPDRDGGSNLKADIDDEGGNVPTGVILGPAPAEVPPGQPAPLTREYDALMPGSGLLIWHVDEKIAWMDYDNDGSNNFEDNDLQWYYFEGLESLPEWNNTRFLRLVEADGIIDFGGSYWTGYGTQDDMFHASGNRHFGPSTNPSTRSNSGAYTGIDINDISGIDTIMYFDLTQELKSSGWTHHTDSSTFSPVLYDIDGDEIAEIFVAGKTYLLGFNENGDFVIPSIPGNEIISERRSTPGGPLNSITYYDTLRVIAKINDADRITTPPAVSDMNADGVVEMAVGTEDGYVYIWNIEDNNLDGRADYVNAVNLSTSAIDCPIVIADAFGNSSEMEFVVGDEYSGVTILSRDGEILSQTIGYNNPVQFSVSADFENAYLLNYTGSDENKNYFIHDINDPSKFIALSDDITGFSSGYSKTQDSIWLTAVSTAGDIYTYLDRGQDFVEHYSGFNSSSQETASSIPVLFPGIDSYGRSQLYFCGENKFYIYNLNGTYTDNYPQVVDLHESPGEITSPPIIVDVTGDGVQEFVHGTSAGEIFLHRSDGTRLITSPLAAPGGISTSLAFCPYSEVGVGRGKLYAVTDDGLIYSFVLPSMETDSRYYYYQADGGSHHRNYQEYIPLSETPQGSILTYSYNYPNPARDFTNIRFEVTDPAEANIRIYDLAGRLILNRDMQAEGEIANEFVWNLEEVPSGVYHCRLEINGSAGNAVELWNIAVVK